MGHLGYFNKTKDKDYVDLYGQMISFADPYTGKWAAGPTDRSQNSQLATDSIPNKLKLFTNLLGIRAHSGMSSLPDGLRSWKDSH